MTLDEDRERLVEEALVHLRDKTPKELVGILELLIKTGLDDFVSSDALGQACSKLEEENSEQQFQFGLLLARHKNPKLRLEAYWRLYKIQHHNQEAEAALWALLDDKDDEVASWYAEQLRETLEDAPRTFARILELAPVVLAAEQRLENK